MLGIERAAGHKLTALDQVGRQPNLQHVRRSHAKTRGVDRRAAGVLAKEARRRDRSRAFRIDGIALAGFDPARRAATALTSGPRSDESWRYKQAIRAVFRRRRART